MIRVLIIIAVTSFVLALACFGGAVALGGRELAAGGWTMPAHFNFEDGDTAIRIGRRRDAGPMVTRDIAWPGGPELSIGVPADVDYTQGAAAGLVISGPKTLVDQLAFKDGRLGYEGEGDQGLIVGLRNIGDDRLKITVVAPAVTKFVLNGSPSLRIHAYDQPDLTIAINGSGDVETSGRTKSLALTIAGSGDADLGGLTTHDASVAIAGSGDARLSAKGAAKIEIAGSGDVTLLAKPASLSSNVSGSGSLHLED